MVLKSGLGLPAWRLGFKLLLGEEGWITSQGTVSEHPPRDIRVAKQTRRSCFPVSLARPEPENGFTDAHDHVTCENLSPLGGTTYPVAVPWQKPDHS